MAAEQRLSGEHMAPVVEPGHTPASVSDQLTGLILRRRWGKIWLLSLLAAAGLFALLMVAILVLFWIGVGIWGIMIPVAWGFAIINFVWWIGIGHAGTLISAFLLLMRQEWRTSINRFAEAMTLFAVACAGLFPLLHLGRPIYFYYLIPYPATTHMWPQFRSPLVWDFFAVLTYGTVSLLFWYIGLIPDLATLRDEAPRRWQRLIYGFFALGWQGSARHWARYEALYMLLAALATPLVISVHTIVSFDFAVGIQPGWHSTVFPPYFVAGAVFSGFACVILLAIPMREFLGLKDFITARHLDFMARILLVTGMMVGYGYVTENFTAWFSATDAERFLIGNRLFGPYGWVYWLTLFCNVLTPQIFWFKRARSSNFWLLAGAALVLVGMWTERFVIVVTSLHRGFVPAEWGIYIPTFWDWATLAGTVGLFLTLFFLFIRFLPGLSIAEMRELVASKADAGRVKGGKPALENPPPLERGAISREGAPSPEPTALVARFDDEHAIVRAAERVHALGYRRIDAHTPFPVKGLGEAIGQRTTAIKLIVLAGGVSGGVGGFLLQVYTQAWAYPHNIAGRPYFSWPAFLPVTFELTILSAAIFGVVGLLALNRLPRPHNPLFDLPGFARVTRDRFMLSVSADDPRFEPAATRLLLEELGAQEVRAL